MLKPNEAMFEAALEIGGRIGMLATFAPAVASIWRKSSGTWRVGAETSASLETYLVPGAREALRACELEKHDGLIAEAASALANCNAIMLAHFTMANAARCTQNNAKQPVLMAPDSAVLKLRSILTKAAAI